MCACVCMCVCGVCVCACVCVWSIFVYLYAWRVFVTFLQLWVRIQQKSNIGKLGLGVMVGWE